jgi:hypothetical protein
MKYDTEIVKPTERFELALKELMRAEMDLMINHEPDYKKCWTWGICEVGDIAGSNGLSFEFGGEEDKPEGFPDSTDCWVKGL